MNETKMALQSSASKPVDIVLMTYTRVYLNTRLVEPNALN